MRALRDTNLPKFVSGRLPDIFLGLVSDLFPKIWRPADRSGRRR